MKLLKNQAWKCIPTSMKSHNHKWKRNKWYNVDGKLKLCSNGFHASKTILDAWTYVNPGFICIVEFKGDIVTDTDKFCSQKMRIVKRYKWSKKDSLHFSIFCVKRSMKYFDRKKFPEVWKVCLRSIKVIDAVLLKDTKKNRDAARSAAWSAESAAWSARSAAWSAWSAVRSAAWSARSAEKKLQEQWLQKYIKQKWYNDKNY